MRILIDADGTLTDGKMYIDHKGEKMFKAFHTRDVRAIRELIANSYEVTIVTADDHESVKHFADKVGADYLFERNKFKLYADYGIADDTWDIPMLKNCNYRYCPSDADIEVRTLPGMHVLKTEGGKGVIAEFIHKILGRPEVKPVRIETNEPIERGRFL